MKKIVFTGLGIFSVLAVALAYRSADSANLLVCSNPAQPSQGVCIGQTSTAYSTTGTILAPAGTVAYTGTLNRTCGSVQCPKFILSVYINE